MKKYEIPLIDLLIFDSEDDILTISTATVKKYDYAAGALNDMMNGSDVNAKGVTTLNLENIIVK